MSDEDELRALALVCTLKPSPARSSSRLLAGQVPHKVSADLCQGLDDVGFSLAPDAVTYWVGEATQGTDYQDLGEPPESVTHATATLAANTAHPARVLRGAPCPPSG